MATIKTELPFNTIQQSSGLFKVLADTTRLSILYIIKEKEMNVTELASALDMEQSAVSHQLKILKNARLVASRREKRSNYYRPNDDHVYHILQQVFAHVEEETESKGLEE